MTGGNAADEAGQPDADLELAALRTQLREASVLLSDARRRLLILEAQAATPQPSVAETPPPPEPSPEPVPVAAAIDGGVAAEPEPPVPPAPAGPDDAESDDGARPDSPGLTLDWERLLGRNWFAIIGAVALVVGVGFFLKLAFDNNWIGDTGRVVLGVVGGLALVGVGEYAQRRVPIWAQPVTAGGIVILYLSIYAAFGFYRLIPPEAAFLFLALVVALAALLALRYESIVMALMGVVGGFVAPVLLGPDVIDVRLALAYVLLVDVGVLAISTFRNWRWFNLVGWVGSYGLFIYWIDEFPGYDPALAQSALSVMFLIFVGATTLFHLLWRRVPGIADLGLMTINAVAFFGLTYVVLWEDYEEWFGLIAVGLALFYALIAYVVIRRPGTPAEIALFALPIAIVFLTIAVPLQLTGAWVTVAWAAEGAALVGTAFLLRRWLMRAFGLGVLGIALGHLAVVDLWWHGGRVNLDDFTPLLNERFPIMAAVVAAFYAAAFLYWYWQRRQQLEPWEEYVCWALAGVANALTLTAFSPEVVDYFDSRAYAAHRDVDYYAFLQRMENGKYLSLTALWSIYAAALLAVGLWRKLPLLRWAGLGLLGLAALKLMAVDTFAVAPLPETYLPVLNWHFLVLALATVLLLAFAWWLRRAEGQLLGYEGYAVPALLVAANGVAIWALSLEAIHYFDSREFQQSVDTFGSKQLTLTVLWAVYAIGVIGVGIARQSSRIRLAGIGMLAIPLAKLFGFDVFLLEREYRVAAFVTLGVLMLGTGLVYQRYSHAVRGFLFGQRV